MNIILNFIEEKLKNLNVELEFLYPGCNMSFTNEEEWKKRRIEIKANIELLLELKSLNNKSEYPKISIIEVDSSLFDSYGKFEKIEGNGK
jgi:hypothetical protein